MATLVRWFGNPKFRYSDPADFLIGTVLSQTLIFLAVVTAVIEYFWRPIDCIVPAQATVQLAKYANSYCQKSDSVFPINHDQAIPSEASERAIHQRVESWLPLLLFWYGIMLRLPRDLWFLASAGSKVNLDNLMHSASSYSSLDDSGKKAMVATTANLFYANYSVQENEKTGCRGKITRVCNTIKRFLPFGHLAIVYILVCLFYALTLKHTFDRFSEFLRLGEAKYDFGFKEMRALIPGSKQEESTPRQSIFLSDFLCDFEVRSVGTIHRYSVQCHVPMSRFYDRATIFLWYALIMVLPVPWVVFARSLFIILPWPRRMFLRRFLAKALSTQHQPVQADTGYTGQRRLSEQEFLKNHILTDGYFILKNLRTRVDELFVYDVVNQLWTQVNGWTGPARENYGQADTPLKEPLLAFQHPSRPTEISRM